mmetsp:Transcript_51349/g.156069  ORF Transcript_51349/g.156069 Transcript_51349/m.156069 type:complete len:256 (-) Transcript_51349:122-889(-)
MVLLRQCQRTLPRRRRMRMDQGQGGLRRAQRGARQRRGSRQEAAGDRARGRVLRQQQLQRLRVGRGLRWADPVPRGAAAGVRAADELSPRREVALDEPEGLVLAMYIEVQLRLALPAALLEIVDPLEALGHAARGDPVDVFDRSRLREFAADLGVDCQDLPVSLTFVDEANGTEHPALHHLSHSNGAVAEIQNVQRVVVARRVVKVVQALGVAVRLGQAAVIEGHGSPKSRQTGRAFGVLGDSIILHVRLHLKFL